MEFVIYLGVAAVSYLLGSIPTAYLVVKQFAQKNILELGTGNVGAMNTHRATNSKWMTAVVFCVDHLKGFLASFLVFLLLPIYNYDEYSALAIALFFVVLGHNFSPWIGFKGGKGLAAAAGFLLGFQPHLVLVWYLVFAIVTGITRYMVLGQIIATALLPLAAYYFGGVNQFRIFLVVLPGTFLVIMKHWSRLENVMNGSEPKMYFREISKEDVLVRPKKRKRKSL